MKEIARLLKNKHVAVITGGKLSRCLYQIVDPLIKYGVGERELKKFYYLPTLGAECYRGDGKVIWKETLNIDQKSEIYNYISSLKTIFKYYKPHKEATYDVEDKGPMITFSLVGMDAPLEYKKNYDKDFSKRRHMRESMKEIKDVEIKIGGTSSFDFVKKNLDKKTAIIKTLKLLNIDKVNALWIGDATFKNGNDFIDNYIDTFQVSDYTETEKILKMY